ncbi:MAG: hypothetical protein EZS28_038189 [Streblomastix strix]|uniref:Uncharacterized protein n=1 Tax=Streblomastix strix TaxID=222440 RepID=A0A5J4U7R1_9EUKA|nr:MAG: hypothetical protein EZS28_038189 [Streblomastix strix]
MCIQLRPIGLIYNILFTIPPLPKLYEIGIYVYDPVIEETISYIRISVTRVAQYVLYLLTVTVTLPLPNIQYPVYTYYGAVILPQSSTIPLANQIQGAPVLVSIGKTHKRIQPHDPLEQVLDNLLSKVVVSPFANSISVAVPPVLINLVAVISLSQVNYWGCL